MWKDTSIYINLLSTPFDRFHIDNPEVVSHQRKLTR